MRDHAPKRPLVLVLLLGAAATAWLAAGLGAGTAVPASAGEDQARVATSVCEAYQLRDLQEANPEIQIEIPPEFDTPWPSRAACDSYAAASDPDAPGPLQPIPFSHKHHAGLYQIDCQYCHSGTDRSRAAGVPSVQLCMGCHSQFPATYDQFEGIRVLKEHWQNQQPIEWVQIHRLPEYVKFQHRAHMRAGFECQQCHGAVEAYDKLPLVQDTVWWPWLLPAKKLEMGWCIDCHRANGATQDCLACHY